MTPIPLEEPTKKDNEKQFLAEHLAEQLMEMPELSESFAETGGADQRHEIEELIHKRMNNINTFHVYENDVYLAGVDEYGKDFQVCFDAYNFLEWIDKDQIEYIKEQTIKYIQEK